MIFFVNAEMFQSQYDKKEEKNIFIIFLMLFCFLITLLFKNDTLPFKLLYGNIFSFSFLSLDFF